MWRCCDRMDVIASFMIFVDISILFEFNEVSNQFSHSLRHLYFNSESSRRWETVSIHHFRIYGNLNGQTSDGKHRRRHQHMFSMVFYPKLQQTKHTYVALFLDIVNDEQRWMNWERQSVGRDGEICVQYSLKYDVCMQMKCDSVAYTQTHTPHFNGFDTLNARPFWFRLHSSATTMNRCTQSISTRTSTCVSCTQHSSTAAHHIVITTISNKQLRAPHKIWSNFHEFVLPSAFTTF